MQRTYSVVNGAKSLSLINNYEMVFTDTRLQPVYTVVLDCPGKDSIRLWPLPVVDPCFEDWWRRPKPPSKNAEIEIWLRVLFFQDMDQKNLRWSIIY